MFGRLTRSREQENEEFILAKSTKGQAEKERNSKMVDIEIAFSLMRFYGLFFGRLLKRRRLKVISPSFSRNTMCNLVKTKLSDKQVLIMSYRCRISHSFLGLRGVEIPSKRTGNREGRSEQKARSGTCLWATGDHIICHSGVGSRELTSTSYS